MDATAQTPEHHVRPFSPVSAPAEQQAQVALLSRALEAMLHAPQQRAPHCQLLGPTGERTLVPGSVLHVLELVTEVMARGDAIAVVPVGRELTTQQAADLLNVSRQYLVRLLDDGRIPSRKTGTHRRVRAVDVVAYKAARDAERRAGLQELSRLTEELGGYDSEAQ